MPSRFLEIHAYPSESQVDIVTKLVIRNRYATIVFWLLFAILINISVCEAKANPRIELEKKTFDLGYLARDGQLQKFSMLIYNTGTKPLEIDFLGSSCGCIVLEKIDTNILPGKKGNIVIAIDPSKAGEGYKMQTLLLGTNDPENEQVAINVYYKIKPNDVAISPNSINVELSMEEMRTSTGRCKNSIIILDSWINRLEITNIQTSKHVATSFYDILYRCQRGSEVHIFRLETELLPSLAVGLFDEWISFTTNHPDCPFVKVPIKGEVLSNVKIYPRVLISNISKNQKVRKNIKIEAQGSSNILCIDNLYVTDKWLQVEQQQINPKIVELIVSINLTKDILELQGVKGKLIKSKIHLFIKKPSEEEKIIDVLCFLK